MQAFLNEATEGSKSSTRANHDHGCLGIYGEPKARLADENGHSLFVKKVGDRFDDMMRFIAIMEKEKK